MVYVFICVDFDRDYAIPMKGLKHAISEPQKNESSETIENPELSSLTKGTISSFEPFISYLKDFKIPTVFYFEARTLKLFNLALPNQRIAFKNPLFEHGVHGYDHEDLTGEETGIVLNRQEESRIIKSAKDDIESILSTKIIGFRAPYMRKTNNTIDILSDLNFKYDSSTYVESSKAIKPYQINKKILEFPVIKTPKESKMRGMYTYLWPLFEGKRTKEGIISNYLQLIKNSKEEKSYISINLHSWHFAYNISEIRYLKESEIQNNVNIFREIIDSIAEIDTVKISTPALWMKEYASHKL